MTPDDLLLLTDEHHDPPALLEVERVVRGVGRHEGWDYARASRTVRTGADADGEPQTDRVVLRRRSGKRWKLPRSGKAVDVQVWGDPDPSADTFEEPESGAGLFKVLRGSYDDEVGRWRRSRHPW